MKYKYHYIRKHGYYIPEISKDGNKWMALKEENLNRHLKCFLEFSKKFENNPLIFSDTKEIYFTTEIGVNMFLGGLKIMLEDQVTEFEHVNL